MLARGRAASGFQSRITLRRRAGEACRWLAETMNLYHGDCLEILPTFPPASVEAIITDLPYGTTACEWDSIIPLDEMWKQVKRVLKPNGVFVTTSAQPFTSALIMSNPSMFKYEWIFEKFQGTGFLNSKKQPLRKHENIIVFYENQCTYNPQRMPSNKKDKSYMQIKPGSSQNYRKLDKAVAYIDDGLRMPTTVLFFYEGDRNNTMKKEGSRHPTQKPVSLYEYLIRTYTNEGDTVLDFCFGSCTTGVAAKRTNRNFIGIEKEKK